MTQKILYAILVFLCVLTGESYARGKRSRGSRHPANAGVESAQAADTAYLQRILLLENQRIAKDKFLVACLSHSSRRVIKAALLALGRIGDTSALDEMARFLSKKDVELAETAAFALSIVGGDTAPKILTQSLVFQKNPSIRAAILLGIGRVGLETGIAPLSQAILRETENEILDNATEGLTLAWSGSSEKWAVPDGLLSRLAKLTMSPEPLSISAAAALSRYKGEAKLIPINEVYEAIVKTPSPSARALLIRVLNRIRTPQAGVLLTALLLKDIHTGVRTEAANALRNQALSVPILEALRSASTNDTNRGVSINALNSIGKFGLPASAATDTLELLAKNSGSQWVRINALKNLARIAPDKTRTLVGEWLKDQAHPLRSSIIATHAVLGGSEDLDKISPILVESDPKTIVETLEELANLSDDKFTDPMKSTLKRLILKNDMGVTALIAQLVEQFKWKDFAPLLASSYGVFNQEDSVEVKVGILNALAAAGDSSQSGVIELATNDRDKHVVSAAVLALKQITGKDLSQKIPLNSKITTHTPSVQELKTALSKQVVLKTTRGEIVLRMLGDGAVSAHQFIQLASSGFYDGKTFHRVVPNFVAQGGDPRGDGFGGPGFLIRDEVSATRHMRGTLGIATAGKDTGGCQFFINSAPNLHLAGRYTLFAEVVSGISVVDTLEIGDKIITAQVK